MNEVGPSLLVFCLGLLCDDCTVKGKGIIFRMRIDGRGLVIDMGPGLNWALLNAFWECPSAGLGGGDYRFSYLLWRYFN